MNITITPTRLSGKTDIIPSKSQAHRLLICAALSREPVRIICSETSEDILATVRCLSALGSDIKKCSDGFSVAPIKNEPLRSVLDCGESGSTLRFLLPVIGALGKESEIHLSGRLPYRPLSPLWEELTAHGMALSKPADNVILCGGRLRGGEFRIPGNISSQFISGLLFALPFLKEKSTVSVIGRLESENYVDMTVDALFRFGIETKFENGKFEIDGGQVASYKNKAPLTAEGDWSNAAFWLTAGALSPEGLSCGNLNFGSLQGDKKIVEILKDFGAEVSCGKNHAFVKKSAARSCLIDAANIPDLVPVLAVCACGANGTTQIVNAGRLKIKESDRLKTVSGMLAALGADISETADGLVINGTGALRGGASVSSCGDHRIAMSAAIASIICENKITITGAEAVSKSYPGFWEDFRRLGGIYEEV